MIVETRKIIFSRPNLLIGHFRCRSGNALWRTENCTGSLPTIVFPRVAVEIRQANHSPVVATPNHLILYNAHHSYERVIIDPRGDDCEYYCVPGEVLEEVARSIGLPVQSSPNSPFEYSHAPCSPRLYLQQRKLFQFLNSNRNIDPLFVEEYFLHLLPDIMKAAHSFHTPRLRNEVCPFQREQVRAAKEYIGRRYRSPLKIEDIAEVADCSVYHLCRIFKKFTGTTIHQFLSQHRLRSSIERILETDRPLIDIALDLGFSSHSHFTNAFRKTFAMSPSALRKSRSMPVLSSNLTCKNQFSDLVEK